jgi:hypothetical protein
VDLAVVVAAEGDRVLEVGVAAVGPGASVVELAPGEGSVAAVGGAGGVPGGERDPLGLGEEALGAAEVEDLGGAGQDRRQDPGAAGEAAGLGGGDPVAGVEAGRGQLVAELVVVEGDDDGGGDLAVQAVGG